MARATSARRRDVDCPTRDDMATATTFNPESPLVPLRSRETTAFTVLAAISVSHLLNDTIQSLVPSIYPMLKSAFTLSFAQVGLITLTIQVTASLLQPLIGHLHRSTADAVFARDRHGRHAGRRPAAVDRRNICRRCSWPPV